MKAVIYSRKSKFTGKGESIENQVQMCKEYAYNHFNISNDDITVYEDEGFSGGTTDRPQFQLMLKDAKQKKFDVLICYRLDRISRNIADFAVLIEELQNYNVSFVSIREQFDTSTPMGRAMMYIASVFAQLERETIAERIRDNLQQLAKTGRWLGGITPTGFISKEIIMLDQNGKQRKAYKLSTVQEEVELVKLLYNKYIEIKSLTGLETYCLRNNIKSKNGANFYVHTLKIILENPVYATADKKLYNYLIGNGHAIFADETDFDGEHGVMAYNKTTQVKGTTDRNRDQSDWIISVGDHEGIISSDMWIKANEIMEMNRDKGLRKRYINTNALLSGILICENCGSFMRKGATRVNKDKSIAYYYLCELKEKSRGQNCNIKNIRGDKLDKLVIEELKRLSSQESRLHSKIKDDKVAVETSQSNIESEIDILKKNIESNNKSIANLINALAQGEGSLAAKHILDQINKLESENANLKEKLLDLRESIDDKHSLEENFEIMNRMINIFKNTIDDAEDDEKRSLIRNLVDRITWDGENIDIVMFGAKYEKR
ncbi:resolvase domain-containing protein [Gottschalkia acidurici 9a]|uniref:Resolvase domain-containing protein n=1 Tax=Gottschalkia acidurici (strain ATCC 7906 / DSM 604 / BCRC 14475 / CIP 104303 / KCTC 5404 / NCIMB 10678 / 9a) TaxID=1128398 RepID=K0AYM6_GOTA9|nr:recombinase family protein [Gottschalkia acidurici]AFS78359.1 resolvase domain-containing protein [Gottschalkia acidurici 9a]